MIPYTVEIIINNYLIIGVYIYIYRYVTNKLHIFLIRIQNLILAHKINNLKIHLNKNELYLKNKKNLR